MNNDKLKQISEEVRFARKSAKMTQEDLALFSGVSRKFISDLENEKPTLEIGKVLIVLAALGITWVLYNRFKD
ncbi:MAG: helix-turn-helix transcriptional regulator [Proteobacteria bacterium]|nr:helix-turn-helix transcriptional regulator [Pseudomonadota bacterium]